MGQPLSLFTKKAEEKGYGLVCYTGNAFYIRKDVLHRWGNSISVEDAYTDFLANLPKKGREWLFVVNRGLVPPFYKFENPFLNRQNLGIKPTRAVSLIINTLFRHSIPGLARYLLKI